MSTKRCVESAQWARILPVQGPIVVTRARKDGRNLTVQKLIAVHLPTVGSVRNVQTKMPAKPWFATPIILTSMVTWPMVAKSGVLPSPMVRVRLVLLLLPVGALLLLVPRTHLTPMAMPRMGVKPGVRQ